MCKEKHGLLRQCHGTCHSSALRSESSCVSRELRSQSHAFPHQKASVISLESDLLPPDHSRSQLELPPFEGSCATPVLSPTRARTWLAQIRSRHRFSYRMFSRRVLVARTWRKSHKNGSTTHPRLATPGEELSSSRHHQWEIFLSVFFDASSLHQERFSTGLWQALADMVHQHRPSSFFLLTLADQPPFVQRSQAWS